MPKITKQTPVVRRKSGSVVDRIAPVGESTTGVKLLVYGRSKTGKTRLACTFPKPMLLIGTEDGTKSVTGIKGLDFVRLQSSTEVDTLRDMLLDGKYKSVGLDTAGGLQDMVLKEILGLEDLPVQRSWGMAKQQDWGTCGAQTKERLRMLLDLAENQGTNVVVIAHERNFSEEGNSELIFPTVGAALTPSAAGWLNGACDYICQTFLREQVSDRTTKIAGKEVVVSSKTGRVEYCLRVGAHPVYMTGFRLAAGRTLETESIVDPSYTKIMELIQGG